MLRRFAKTNTDLAWRGTERSKTMSLMFELVEGGIGVMPDPEDNPNNHVVPRHDAGTRISFAVLNVGDAAATLG